MRDVYVFAELAQAQGAAAAAKRYRFFDGSSEQAQTDAIETWMGSGDPSVFIAYVAVQPNKAVVPTQIHEATL